MPATTPADVLARRRQLMLEGDADGFADLFAPGAVMEFCFHGTPGTPVRVAGRAAIRAYARQFTDAALRVEEYEVPDLYQTQDPEVVIAEMRSAGVILATGQPVTARSIQVLRFDDGHITLFRDFADPRVFEELRRHTHEAG